MPPPLNILTPPLLVAGFITWLKLRKKVSLKLAIENFMKFNIWSVTAVALTPLLYVLKKKELTEVYERYLEAPTRLTLN